MLLRQESGNGVDVLAVTGDVARDDARELVTVLQTALDRALQGVVVDLREVTDLDGAAAQALRGVAAERSRWPRSSLCLCGAPPGVEDALQDLVVHPTRADAFAHVGSSPLRTREVAAIEHSPRGPAQARRVVAECAQRLGLDEQGHDLVLVVSEMVTNAVRHGAPPVHLEVVADADAVMVAVVDGSARWPEPRVAEDDAEGGRGMALVDLLSSEHGVDPHPPGKTVWARVQRRTRAGSS